MYRELNEKEKKTKRLIMLALTSFYTLCAVFILIGIGSWWNNKETFYLTADQVSMIVNDNYRIGMYGKTEQKRNNNYIYTSDNESIAIVDENGIINAVSEGEAYVTVKSKFSSKKNKILVHVQGTSIYSVEFENENITLNKGDITRISPIVNGDPNFKTDLVWSSENNRVVTISKDGEIKAVTAGITNIMVKVRGTNISSKAQVRVVEEGNNQIVDNSIPSNTGNNGNNNNNNGGTSGNSTGNNSKPNSSNPNNQNKPSTPSNPNNQNKPSTPSNPGYVNPDDDESGFEDEELNTYIGVISVNASVSKSSLKIGERVKVNYTISPSNATNKGVIWSSSNSSVASVDAYGNVTAKAEGKADIIVTTKDGNKTSFVTINVAKGIVNASTISLNKTNTSLVVGGSETLIATISPSNATDKSVVWSSSNDAVATVNQSGKISARAVGNVKITVKTKNGKSATCDVNVKNQEIRVTSVSLNKTSLNLSINSSYKLVATVAPSSATNQKLKWSSSNSKVVSVDAAGNIKALTSGSANITVTTEDGNKQATCNVTVPAIKVSKITLNKSSAQLVKGNTLALKVSVTPSNATNKGINYSSNNTAVATVDANGKITTKGLGMATIKAKAKDGSGKTASIKIVVVAKGALIDVRKQTYHSYHKDIVIYETSSSTSSKHMQNFAISNLGKSNETIYLSTVTSGCIAAKTLTAAQKKDLNRTIVMKIPKSAIGSPRSSSRKVMYLVDSGHGQAFDMEPDSDIMWLNAYGKTPTYSSNKWWGGHIGIQRVKFSANKKDAKVTTLQKFKIKDSSGNDYSGLKVSIDADNNLIAIRTGSKILVYNYSDFKKGKLTLIYQFKASSTLSTYSNGSTIYGQGIAFHNGYFYRYRGAPGKTAYIEAWNLLGELQYTAKLSLSTANSREPEGMKIYNNRIYIGSTHTKSGVSGSLMDIGYFK